MPLPFHCVGRFTAKLMLDAAASTGAMAPRTWQYSPSVLPVASAAISVAAVTVAPPEASVSAEAGTLAPFSALHASSALNVGWAGWVGLSGLSVPGAVPGAPLDADGASSPPPHAAINAVAAQAAASSARRRRMFDPDVMLWSPPSARGYLCRHAGARRYHRVGAT
ncbi:hypothetical protein D3C87_1104960 [compost metagenome]